MKRESSSPAAAEATPAYPTADAAEPPPALLGYLVLDYVTGFESSHLDHNLAGSPVDGPCRSRIVQGFGDIQVLDFSIGTVDCHILELGECSEGVVVVLDDPVGKSALGRLYLERPAHCK